MMKSLYIPHFISSKFCSYSSVFKKRLNRFLCAVECLTKLMCHHSVRFTFSPPSVLSLITCNQVFFCVFHFRQQVTEIIFVLKAISTLMDSLKKTQPENGEYQTVERWNRTAKKKMTWEIIVLCLPAAHSVKCVRGQLGVFFWKTGISRLRRAVFFQQGRPVIIVIIAAMYGNQALKLISFKMFG